jgi:uncharacterized membrane protein
MLSAAQAARPGGREAYIDAFRGVMALVMVQGHLFETLVRAADRDHPLYQFQMIFHGSTAPGFLFASGFVAGLPRAPLSLRASLRRARRLLFVLGVGYALHLPYFSLWKTLEASPAEKAALFACDALQAIAVTQLLVLVLQWIVRQRWTAVAATTAAVVLVATPSVWASSLPASLPPWAGSYFDRRLGSLFPLFPFSAFVLAGTVAGAALGRQERRTRRRRGLVWGTVLVALGAVTSWLLMDRVDFWGPSPGYALLRLGGLVLLLLLVEAAAVRGLRLIGPLSLLGRETLQVFVLHLYLLYGGVLAVGPLHSWAGQLGFLAALGVLVAMIPVLFAAAWVWHRVKARAPHEAELLLVFLGTWFVAEYLTRPW